MLQGHYFSYLRGVDYSNLDNDVDSEEQQQKHVWYKHDSNNAVCQVTLEEVLNNSNGGNF